MSRVRERSGFCLKYLLRLEIILGCHDPGFCCFISCFILKPCPCVSLLAFQFPLCVSLRYLTCPFPHPTHLTCPWSPRRCHSVYSLRSPSCVSLFHDVLRVPPSWSVVPPMSPHVPSLVWFRFWFLTSQLELCFFFALCLCLLLATLSFFFLLFFY